MLHFIACKAPDYKGLKVADGLARANVTSGMPHLAFKSKELAQYYIDVRNANKLCYTLSEDDLKETFWFDFRDGIVCFNSIRDIRKALDDTSHIHSLSHTAYEPVLSGY